MDLPSRESLLDIDWLVRTHAEEGAENLARYLLRGAEVYGGPATAVAEAVLSPRIGMPSWTDHTDVRHVLACKLLAGSWSPDPSGPWAYQIKTNKTQVLLSTLPAVARTEFLARARIQAFDPPMPDLHQLRLIEPLDRAWVGHAAVYGPVMLVPTAAAWFRRREMVTLPCGTWNRAHSSPAPILASSRSAIAL